MKKLILLLLLSMTITNIYAAKSTWPEMSIFHMKSSWQNHNGKKVTLEKLAGHITLVAMVYTSCEHTCPLIVEKMRKVKKALPKKYQDKIKLSLISFDPEGDTPATLSLFKKRRSLNESWSLLTGKPAGIRKLAAILGVSYKKEDSGVFSHSNIISVLTAKGVVAGRIEELNESSDEIVKIIIKLLKK